MQETSLSSIYFLLNMHPNYAMPTVEDWLKDNFIRQVYWEGVDLRRPRQLDANCYSCRKS